MSDEQCAQFLCEHGAQHCFEEKLDGHLFSCAKASPIFETAKHGAYRVDIKGQI